MENVKKYEDLIGKTFTKVEATDNKLSFISDKDSYMFYFSEDRAICYEDVYIEDICGDLKDLENSPILEATEYMFDSKKHHFYKDGGCDYGSGRYTFYTFKTFFGSVWVRWFGESNGYYSETVDFINLKNYED